MRAREPDQTGFIERDGIRVYWELLGDGDRTVLFLPTWSLFHSRHWKMQLPYFARHFRETTHRPVVACFMDLGTGGAYYLATASDVIVAHPTTITGGIGVVLNLFNLEDAINVLNVTTQSIKAGAKIDVGSVTRALEPDEEALLQRLADGFHERFRAVVRRQRPHLDAASKDSFDGRVFSAAEAQKRGLVDQVLVEPDRAAVDEQGRAQPARSAPLLSAAGSGAPSAPAPGPM